MLYLRGSCGGQLHALDTESGELIWQYRTGEGMYSLAAMGGLVYAGTLGHIFAVDGLNEVPRWRVPDTALAPISSEGVIHIENVVQCADGFVDGVAAIYAEIGEILWTFHTDIRLGQPREGG